MIATVLSNCCVVLGLELVVPLAFMYLPTSGLIDLIQHDLFFLPAFLFRIRTLMMPEGNTNKLLVLYRGLS